MSMVEKESIKKVIKNLDKEDLKEIKHELYLDRKDKGVLDAVQERLISRKLLVFLVSTALLYSAGLDSETWGMIAMMYIGGQSAVDIAKVWRG
tara:strand:+ start:765 stop:1043 length:279 start_codon:yes stop_codon:yes gene_type:complete